MDLVVSRFDAVYIHAMILLPFALKTMACIIRKV